MAPWSSVTDHSPVMEHMPPDSHRADAIVWCADAEPSAIQMAKKPSFQWWLILSATSTLATGSVTVGYPASGVQLHVMRNARRG